MIAIRMCDRFYLGVLERVATVAKLEQSLGLFDSRTKKTSVNKVVSLSKDKYLLPQRWLLGTDFSTTEEFIKKYQNAGVNHLAKTTFRILIGLDILLVIASIAIIIL